MRSFYLGMTNGMEIHNNGPMYFLYPFHVSDSKFWGSIPSLITKLNCCRLGPLYH